MPQENIEGRTQTSFSDKKDFLKFVSKQEFSYEIVDFDVGDVNGDGENEFILIDRYRVMIFKSKKGYLRRVAQVKTRKSINHFLGVDVADINGNGRDEIFVTNQTDDKLSSFALETQTKTEKAPLHMERCQPLFPYPPTDGKTAHISVTKFGISKPD